MKTIKDCELEIKQIEASLKYDSIEWTDARIKKQKNRILFLRDMIKYLELNPSQEFILSERSRLENLINAKKLQFEDWRKNVAKPQKDPNKYFQIFCKEIGISDWKKSINTLNFLLS